MRKRYQKGSLKKVEGKWIAQWWEDGHRRKKTLGLVSKVPKAQAQNELDSILSPINSRSEAPSAYSGPCRSAFRGDGDQCSKVMPIAIPG